MEKRHLVFFFFTSFIGIQQVSAQTCSLSKHQITHLKQALLCRSEESLTKCKLSTKIGLSPEELVAAGIGEDMSSEVTAKLWNDQIKLCRIPGFSFWFEILSSVSHAKTLECVTHDIYVGTLFNDVHKQVNETLMKNMEDLQKSPPDFLKDEDHFKTEILSKQKNLKGLPDNPYEYALNLSLKTAPLTATEKSQLLDLGMNDSHLVAIENHRKFRGETFEKMQKLNYKHLTLVQKLKGKVSLNPAEAKLYSDFIKDLPAQNQSEGLREKIRHFQFQTLTKISSLGEKAVSILSAKERAEKEAIRRVLEFILPKNLGARIVPGFGLYENVTDGVKTSKSLYDSYVGDAFACELFSDYTRVDENCIPVRGNHSGVLEFLSQDWKTQQAAIHADTALCENINEIYKKYTDPPYIVTCNENGFVARSKNKSLLESASLGTVANYVTPDLQIEGSYGKNGNLEKLVYEASRRKPDLVDNRTFAMTYKNGVIKELRYQKLPPALAVKYNGGASIGLKKEKWRREIATFSNEAYYIGYDVKEDLSDPEKPRGQKAIAQVQENNFYITEILGCCNKQSKFPGNLRCKDYGINKDLPEQRQPAATPTR